MKAQLSVIQFWSTDVMSIWGCRTGIAASGAFATDGTTILAGQSNDKVLEITYGAGCTAKYTVSPHLWEAR